MTQLEDRSVPAAITGTVFYDTNADGIQNNNESTAPGITVTITPEGGSPVTGTTDDFGHYSFTGIAPGSYTVGFTAPTGYSIGSPTSVTVGTENVGVGVGLIGDGTGSGSGSGSGSGTGSGSGSGSGTTLGSPLAIDDNRVVGIDSIAIMVLENDFDPNGETVTVVAIGNPVHGTAVYDGLSVNYTPESGYQGTDSFTYTISNASGLTASATISLQLYSDVVQIDQIGRAHV